MATPENRKLVQDLRKQESVFGSTVQVPPLWTSKKYLIGKVSAALEFHYITIGTNYTLLDEIHLHRK